VWLDGAERLNPSGTGQSLTTQVQVLQLKSPAKLERAEFADVWQKPKETLGDDLLETNEVTLDPNGRVTTGFVRNPKAGYIGVIGLFRQPTGTSWRAITPLPVPTSSQCESDPEPVKKMPDPGDHVLRFFLQDFRVEFKSSSARAGSANWTSTSLRYAQSERCSFPEKIL
jgi:type VI secretion system protein VasD